MKAKPTVHQYAGDGQSDGTGADRCTVCLMPKKNYRHRVPIQPAALAEFEARKLGEREPAELPTNVIPFRPRPDKRTAGKKAGPVA